MTLEDLREQGVLLPEEEWGEHQLVTTAPSAALGFAFLTAAGACLLALLGDGGLLTWIGMGIFVAALLAITVICDRAVARQRRRVERERAELREPSTR